MGNHSEPPSEAHCVFIEKGIHMKDKIAAVQTSQNPLGFWYVLGIVGSAVYFIQQVDGFWPIVLALLKALVWPAFLTYDALRFLAR